MHCVHSSQCVHELGGRGAVACLQGYFRTLALFPWPAQQCQIHADYGGRVGMITIYNHGEREMDMSHHQAQETSRKAKSAE